MALIQEGVEKMDEEGQRIIEFMIKPSDLLKKRYNIRESMLDRNKNIPFKAYKQDLIALNQFDDANRKWLYLKTYNHDETEVSKVGWEQRKKIAEMQKRIIFVEGELIWLSEQLQLAKTNPAEFATQGMEIFDKVSSRTIEMMRGKKDKED